MDNKKDLDIYIKEIYFASFGKRFSASLIDGLILFVVAMLLLCVVNLGLPTEISIRDALIVLITSLLYDILLIYFFGMTIGKRIMKIKVVSNLKNKVSLKQAVLRCIFKYLSGYILYIGFLWMLKNEFNQTWHDILANTLVIDNEYEDEISEYIVNNPWKVSNKHRIIKIGALLLTLLIFSYTNLNKFVNKEGNFGIEEVYNKNFNEAFYYTKLLDIDNDNSDEIVTISEMNKGLSINIYDWEDNEIKKVESFDLEEKETSIVDWEIADLDNDGMFEVAVALKQDKKGAIKIYKRSNNTFASVKTLDFKRDMEIVKDEEGKNHLVCYYTSKIISYSFSNGELVEDYSGRISTTGLGIEKADFNGDGIDELYFVKKDKSLGSKKVKCKFIKIDQSDNGIVESDAGEIDLKSNVYKERLDYNEPHNFIIDDIDGDEKDDVVFQTTSILGLESWLNIVSFKEDKWTRIYSGGYFEKIRRHKGLFLSFLGKADINGDGLEELVMGGDVERAYWDEVDGDPVENRIFLYQIDPIKFKLNSFFQRLNSPFRKAFPILR